MKKVLCIGGSGFIGTALRDRLALESEKYEVTNFDIDWFRIERKRLASEYEVDYYKANLDGYDVVVLLAGHSSVAQCKVWKSAFNNNVRNFTKVISSAEITGTRLIYASSASVYGSSSFLATEETKLSQAMNPYDLTKQTIDRIAALSRADYYGLRFGTLSGYSRNPRIDVLINSMVYSAQTKNYIALRNPEASRAVLNMEDCTRAIKAVIDCPVSNPGVYNVSSFNDTIGNIAAHTAKEMDVPVFIEPNSSTYSFSLNTNKFFKQFNFYFENNVWATIRQAKENIKHISSPLLHDRNKVIFYE